MAATGTDRDDKPLINLLRGWPHPLLLPVMSVERAAREVLADDATAIPGLLYAPDPGDERLRILLANWLGRIYFHKGDHERIAITGGASQNIACILQTYSDPVYTRNIWIVAPAYMLLFRMLDDSGFHSKLRAVPEDEEGVDIEYLRQEITKSEAQAQLENNDRPVFKVPRPWSKIYKHIIYAVPSFSNPSSRIMTLRGRLELVKLAREFDALIIADDVYDLLQWRLQHGTGPTLDTRYALLPRLVDIDRTQDGGAERDGADGFGNAMSNGSFSKICGPGTRTGWAEGTRKFAWGLSQTGTTRSGGAPSHLVAVMLAQMLETGALQRHIYKTLQPAYAGRWRTMISALKAYMLPLGVTIPYLDKYIAGGYFVWIILPVPADEVAERAQAEQNLIVAPGSLFEVPGDTQHPNTSFPNALRLCLAWEDEARLGEGVARLAVVVGAMLLEKGSGNHETDGSSTRSKSTLASFS